MPQLVRYISFSGMLMSGGQGCLRVNETVVSAWTPGSNSDLHDLKPTSEQRRVERGRAELQTGELVLEASEKTRKGFRA